MSPGKNALHLRDAADFQVANASERGTVSIQDLFEKNRQWAQRTDTADPEFFNKLAKQQSPEYLWIGCSDSRVPANQIVDLLPGDIFVHRNVANQVIHTDLNCLSVLQFAVDVLKVKHIIVCGHYGCGGVAASIDGKQHGLIDNWLHHIEDVAHKHEAELSGLSQEDKVSRLCELNVLEQAKNVARTSIVKDALARGQDIEIHSWIYSLKNGRLKDLEQQ
ncbi:Carbonate dehydratase [Saliniradius amylolyticus]|uniref:Carbonic anhydrase n=1 Tax=Saliniradius amylolyticus TaxID=2183582 RepID=A0A2S2E7A1_9ALTE|nr:carbonate dehydratase [Saliniradius amylolyticus]AWL13412.1 Carbonate dehydratase [Saliniradius amylolyticus]